MTKIVLAGPNTTAERVAKLRETYPEVEFVVPETRAHALDLVGDADGFVGNMTNREFLAAEQLSWIQAISAGVEFIWDIPRLRESDVVVTNMRGAHAATIAEHAFAMLLAMTRGLHELKEHQRHHEWARGQVSLSGLKGLTMGIVGFGNIGRAIARRANGFEMNLLAVDAHSVPHGEGVQQVWPLTRLNELCAAVDVLAISTPITPVSQAMIGREQLGAMKRGARLLVMSRGKIVDPPALIEALESGHLAGAGLDVTFTEPLPADDHLWDAPNLIITPHVSAVSTLTADLTWSILSQNIGHLLRGEPLINQIDKSLGY